MTDFVHLHLHTEYSLLDGACSIHKKDEKQETVPLIARAKELGMKAIAITDHGAMYGAISFYKECKAAGIKPIIGCEVYVAARTRFDKNPAFDAERYHLVLLAKNMQGYENLINIVSYANLDGFYVKPRCDMELLERYHEGIIALSACLAGELPRRAAADDYEGARECALRYKAIFGEDYYIELQNHGLEEQMRINPMLIRLAKELDIPLVATNDVHYINREDAEAQKVLMCIQMGKTVEDENRLDFGTDQFYFKSGDEMAALFPGLPQAIENTVRIAEQCNVEFEFHKLSLPKYDVPGGEEPFAYLRARCMEGFVRRYGDHPPEEAMPRMEYELEVIRSMGYVDYFLIVWDFIHFARSAGIPVGPGRGSAAGSIVSYCLTITDVDPLQLGLLFERFLNPERVSMPDIDIDFCYERRQEVIDYVVRKYGDDHVAQIVTFGTMLAKGAIRDVGRALNMPYADVDAVAKLVPNELKMTIDKAMKPGSPLREMYDANPDTRRLIDMAKQLEGMPRHTSIHAAGVVITGRPVHELVPLQRGDSFAITQYTMTTLEELGLLKMDFLGLRNLTVIADAEKMINRDGGHFSVAEVPFDDKKVYEMLSAGQTAGVFQLESGGMKNVLTGLRPRSLEDIIAVISLFRPGPMDSIPSYIENMHNPDQVTYKHPLLEPILRVTYGCIVYQEQVMQIVRDLGGYSYGRADLVRRAMSKKKASVMEQERTYFIHGKTAEDGTVEIEGAVRRGVPEQIASEIFDEMTAFASYAFNKSHAAAYAVVAYRTAYLKAHYPCEYMAALLTSILDTPGKVSEYIAECQRLGIRVLPPDINTSGVGFTVEDGNIRFGLVAIKNIGYGVIEAVIAERETGGPFAGFYDFLIRVADKEINKKAVEALIVAGAFDSFGRYRSQLLAVYERALSEIQEDRRRNVEGQLDLFGMAETAEKQELIYPDIPEMTLKEKLTLEKAATGLYLSGHPLSEYRAQIEAANAAPISEILESFTEGSVGTVQDGDTVTIAGVILTKKNKNTRNDSLMAFVTLEDMSGSIEALVFPKVLTRYAPLLAEEAVVSMTGKVSAREGEEPKLICDAVAPLAGAAVKKPKKLYLRLRSADDPNLARVERVTAIFDGTTPLIYYFGDEKKYSPAAAGVEVTAGMLARLNEILGADNVVFR